MLTKKSEINLPSFTELTIKGGFAGMAIALAGYAGAIAGNSLLKAIIFPAGLLLIILAGFHLFTGNVYKFADLMNINPFHYFAILIWNWMTNYVGAALTAILLTALESPTATTIIPLVEAKANTNYDTLFVSGIMCNILVCLAIALSQKYDGILKILAVYIPIFFFVICGFEHSIADIFYFEYGIVNEAAITLQDIFNQLIPISLGNIFGGLFVYICKI